MLEIEFDASFCASLIFYEIDYAALYLPSTIIIERTFFLVT